MAVAEPNHLLVGARTAARLTQESLANLANAQVELITKRPGAMDSDYISKLERGVHRWPSKHYRQALRTVLGANSDLELGFYSTRTKKASVTPIADPLQDRLSRNELFRDPFSAAQGSENVKRQAFLRALAATAAGMTIASPAAEAMARAAADVPVRQVGMTDVSQIDQAADMFGQWQDVHGGGATVHAIAGQVSWASSLLGAQANEKVRLELYRSVGFLANIAAWGAVDDERHGLADRYFELALHCAELAQSWGLRSNILADRARQQLYLGRAEAALDYSDLSQVRIDRQPPLARSMLSTVKALALAKVGRHEDSYAEIQRAEEYFTYRAAGDEDAWIAYFDDAELAGEGGHALLDVALNGQYIDQTRQRLAASINAYGTEQKRARAFSLCRSALLELKVGDRELGIAHGEKALTIGSQIKSKRVHNELTRVRMALVDSNKVSGAAELQARFASELV